MVQSLRIIEQCVNKLEKLPKSAPYINKKHPAVMAPKQDVFNDLEDMVKNFRIVVHGEEAPPGEVFSSAENPRFKTLQVEDKVGSIVQPIHIP